MPTFINLFTLLIMISTPAWAVDSDCERWLAETEFAQIANPRAVQPTNYSIVPLVKTFKDFVLSEFRSDANNYNALIEPLVEMIIHFKMQLSEKQNLFDIETTDYKQKFGPLKRVQFWGAPAEFRRTRLNPLEEDLEAIKKGLIATERLLAQVQDAKNAVIVNRLLFDAGNIFQATRMDFGGSPGGVAIVKALIHKQGNLRPWINNAKEIYDYFVTMKYPAKVASLFATAMISAQASGRADLLRMEELYKKMAELYSESVAASLATFAFKKGLAANSFAEVTETYDAIVKSRLFEGLEALPIVTYFLQIKRVPKDLDIEQLRTFRQILFAHRDITSRDAAMMMAAVLSTKREVVVNADFRRILEIFVAYESLEPTLRTVDRAILASATFLVNNTSSDFAASAVTMWRQVKDWPEVSSSSAASVVFNILLLQHPGVSSDLVAGLGPASSSIAESVSSSNDYTELLAVPIMTLDGHLVDDGVDVDASDSGDSSE